MPPAPELEKIRKKKRAKTGRLYWSISDVADLTGVKPHVLRYWETEFPTLKPKKNSAGNRHYRERDVELVLAIKHLLYNDQFTIKGARQRLNETRKVRELLNQLEIPFATADQRQALLEIKRDLVQLRKDLG
ncbi:MAG: MerR family transcriptional regulator [bacterium]|nr:MerR family transcriptional regulator [bacterium]